MVLLKENILLADFIIIVSFFLMQFNEQFK